MRQVYFEHHIIPNIYSLSGYYFENLVKPGKVLVVKRISYHRATIADAELVWFMVETGTTIYGLDIIQSVGAGAVVSIDCDIAIGEGKAVGIYDGNADNGETSELLVLGELWEWEDWEYNLK